jgi:hypothetical protein
MNLKINGLNMKYGGGATGYLSLPMYDIAIMVALGFSAHKIAKILSKDYGLFKDFKLKELERAVQYRIADILGGSYRAQEELLQPIIEYLDNIEGITRQDIYQAFKEAEFSSYGWFLEWSYGREFLKADIDRISKIFNLDPKSSWEEIKSYLKKEARYYAGIPESKWLEWIFYSVPRRSTPGTLGNTLQDLAKIGERKIKNILKILCAKYGVGSKDELMYKLHKEKAIELISQGFIEYPSDDDPNLTIKESLRQEDFFEVIYSKIFST